MQSGLLFFFFFQAEDGIRDYKVTGVQTCALPILKEAARWAGDSGFLEDRTRHWEDEIDRLAEDSARRIATGQPCAGLPTVVKHWPELAEVLSTSFVDRTSTPKPGSAAAKVKGFTLTGLATALEEPPEVTAYVVDG